MTADVRFWPITAILAETGPGLKRVAMWVVFNVPARLPKQHGKSFDVRGWYWRICASA